VFRPLRILLCNSSYSKIIFLS